MRNNQDLKELIEKLSPLERKVIPFLKSGVEGIKEKSGLDQTSIIRALQFLEKKDIVKIKSTKKIVVVLGTNGIYYKKNHLPERNLITALEKNNRISFDEAKKLSKLTDNEFKVSLGVLKNKNFLEIKDGKIIFKAEKSEVTKKTLEEVFLDSLPIEESSIDKDSKETYLNLKKRKDIIETKEENFVDFDLTSLGEKILKEDIDTDLIEEVTPEVIKNWKKNKKFRKYSIDFKTSKIFGGRKHFVSEAIEHGKRIWLDLGFKEMTGNKIQTSFWNFDALFTAQDHPVRELHDTFFLKNIKGKLPEKKIVENVKKAHESGVGNSKGWRYEWKEEEAKKVVLRTHTTCLSAITLSKIKKEDLPMKLFAIGRTFRNETVDWSHGFEFNQTEGIVIDKNANLRHLMGYLKEFAEKMGFTKIRIQPAYFPYTEPSLEGAVWNEEKQSWVEVLAAGIFRPEVTIPLLGEHIPILAWGPGFDRLMMFAYKIKDMRDIYKNDLKQLREMNSSL